MYENDSCSVKKNDLKVDIDIDGYNLSILLLADNWQPPVLADHAWYCKWLMSKVEVIYQCRKDKSCTPGTKHFLV